MRHDSPDVLYWKCGENQIRAREKAPVSHCFFVKFDVKTAKLQSLILSEKKPSNFYRGIFHFVTFVPFYLVFCKCWLRLNNSLCGLFIQGMSSDCYEDERIATNKLTNKTRMCRRKTIHFPPENASRLLVMSCCN